MESSYTWNNSEIHLNVPIAAEAQNVFIEELLRLNGGSDDEIELITK